MSEDCPHCVYEKTEANCRGCFEGSHYRPKPITKDLVDEVLKAFYELERQRVQTPHVFMGGKTALSIKKNYPDAWKEFISTLRQKGARLFLQEKMGELPREYDIWKEDDNGRA